MFADPFRDIQHAATTRTTVTLNGAPWVGTYRSDATLSAVQSWIDTGLDLGVLDPDKIEHTSVDTVLDLASGVVINFTGALDD